MTLQDRHPYLLHEAESAHGCFPVADVLGLELDQRHTRVLWSTRMHAIAQVAHPGAENLAVERLDARVVVGGLGAGSRDRDPILIGRVLEGDLCGGTVRKIGELLGVGVGQEEEVGACALEEGQCIHVQVVGVRWE